MGRDPSRITEGGRILIKVYLKVVRKFEKNSQKQTSCSLDNVALILPTTALNEKVKPPVSQPSIDYSAAVSEASTDGIPIVASIVEARAVPEESKSPIK